MRSIRFSLPLAAVILAHASLLAAAGELIVFPPVVHLTSREARQRLVVQRATEGVLRGEVRTGLRWTSSNPQVAVVEENVALPKGNGRAQVTATVGDESVSVDVEVAGQEQPHSWSFRNHVESILSKQGCNGGACHGALKGKNGFRLRLFGYDPEADFLSITREDRGRRLNLADPGRSLLLVKPTGVLPHKGGVRLDVDSLEYRVLAEWISAGAPGPQESDPRLVKLEMLPPLTVQQVGAQQQLLVLAHFSDGHVEDVTSWAKYRATNESVATVDTQGLVKIVGPGEGGFHAWYLNHNVLAFASVPYDQRVEPGRFSAAEARNFVDVLVLEKLQALNLPPSPLCDDATFLRRAYLDTLGLLPTAEESRTFLADADPLKREKLVETLFARPEFVDFWAYKWSDLLLASGQRLRPAAVKAYYGFIRQQVAAGTPWDKFVRAIVTASGNTLENGAANFYALHQDPNEMAETTSMAFLGMSINCAKCHNHPLEKWTNDQYYGFASLFSRVRAKGWGGDFRNGDGLRVIFADSSGEWIQPSRGRPQPPTPLDGAAIPFDAPGDRRQPLADWLTSPQNPYFTRAIVNRIWAHFFAVGLVEKVDDLRLTNPASNEKLLAAAAAHLVEQKYDLKALMRTILGSATYQRSSVALPENRGDSRFYSHYYPRRLKAEVLLDAISQVSGVPTPFKDYPAGTRALQLPDSDVGSYFLTTFGRPERIITCECERSDEPSMVQVLHLMNGETVMGKLATAENRLAALLAQDLPPESLWEELFLTTLCRRPTETELAKLTAEYAQTPVDERRLLLEDIYWSVLSSKEFLFNH